MSSTAYLTLTNNTVSTVFTVTLRNPIGTTIATSLANLSQNTFAGIFYYTIYSVNGSPNIQLLNGSVYLGCAITTTAGVLQNMVATSKANPCSSLTLTASFSVTSSYDSGTGTGIINLRVTPACAISSPQLRMTLTYLNLATGALIPVVF